MGCAVVCAAGGVTLADAAAAAVMVFAVAVAVALAVAAVSLLVHFVWAAGAAILVVDALGVVAFVRMVKYGGPREVFRRHRRVTLRRVRRLAVTRGPAAIEAPQPVVHAVITDAREKAHR